ncbi:MAG: hypothetical protein HY826_00350 [Actinobacteria bacterium]|nr:hypothetical protein [Actinomycetota bacterium]
MANTGKRPFWAHQLVEYILGAGLVASGLQSPTPLVPSILGGFVLLYAAATRGALAAFRLIDRRVHRVADPVVVSVQIVAALQPWVEVDNATRIVIVAIAIVHLVVWMGSSFTQKSPSPKVAASQPPGDRSTEIGRSAGRLAAKGVRAFRTAKANRTGK